MWKKRTVWLNCLFVIAALLLMVALSGSAMGISTTPGHGEKDVSVDAEIIITFEKPMDINTVEVTIDPDPGIVEEVAVNDLYSISTAHDETIPSSIDLGR